MKLSVITAFLSFCAAAWIPFISASGRSPSNCCLKVSRTKPPLENIVGYTVQQAGLCPVNAIVFKTSKGNWVCSNPENDWVKRAMAQVDERRKSKGEAASDAKVKKSAKKSTKRRQGRKGSKRGNHPAPKTTPQKN
ncbi:hypothetical protein GJAV_G00083610 [Gymnothorax javanicus]|nr:hypothetical protein GJAV_G00083610 [Gymnothorax javanicus]